MVLLNAIFLSLVSIVCCLGRDHGCHGQTTWVWLIIDPTYTVLASLWGSPVHSAPTDGLFWALCNPWTRANTYTHTHSTHKHTTLNLTTDQCALFYLQQRPCFLYCMPPSLSVLIQTPSHTVSSPTPSPPYNSFIHHEDNIHSQAAWFQHGTKL